jgi:hypothetical protein
MVLFIILLMILVVATEALTELLAKSEIFSKFRELILKIPFLGEAIKCGYCTSVWVAILPTIVVCSIETPMDHYTQGFPSPLIWVIWLVFFHRMSNYLHNINDKWFDKYYSKKD